MATLGKCILTLGDVLRGYDLPAGARESIEFVIKELAAPSSAGAWTLDTESGQIRDENGYAMASVPWSLGDATDRANGRLIAAAPELYAACQRMVASPVTEYAGNTATKRAYFLSPDDLVAVHAAIAKVRG